MALPIARDCWFLTGPTAGGKSEVGLHLAFLLSAEIVSLDSMAVYRQLDIGTAKPSAVEQSRVSHHLLDLVEPEEEFSVAQYFAAAEQAVAQIAGRERTALFVGGTPLYLKALLRGIFPGPPADWSLREQLAEEAARHEPGWLHAQLAEIDPLAAGRLHPRDTRRLIRALEVYASTGRPISDLQRQFERARPAHECRVFVLEWPRELLDERINRRVEAMFARGLVAEVAGLQAAGRTLGRTAGQALGYREVLEHLAGSRSLAETIDLVQLRTRQFARRQLTWFRSLGECRRVAMTDGGQSRPAEEIAREIAAAGAAL